MQRSVTLHSVSPRTAAEEGSFKPIGFALAAVVAGLAPAGAEALAEPAAPMRDAPVPETIDYAAEQDDSLLLGPSEAVEPFAEAPAKPAQGDLFEL
jgi:hypothetical protein